MVYESDFYTSRRPYTRPSTISSYTVTRMGNVGDWDSPYSWPVRREFSRILHKPRPHVGIVYTERFLNSRPLTYFDDETKLIRARAGVILRQIQTPAVKTLNTYRPFQVLDSYHTTNRSTPYGVPQHIYQKSFYSEPAHITIGRGHLACVQYAGGRSYPRRKNLYSDENRNIRDEIKFRSYYNRVKHQDPNTLPTGFAWRLLHLPAKDEKPFKLYKHSRTLPILDSDTNKENSSTETGKEKPSHKKYQKTYTGPIEETPKSEWRKKFNALLDEPDRAKLTSDAKTPTVNQTQDKPVEKTNADDELKKEELRKEELRKEELRKEELRNEELRKEELRKEELKKEEQRKEELRLEELRKEEQRKEELRLEELRKEEQRKEELRLEELKKEELRLEELKKEEQKKEELRLEELKKEEQRKEELRLEELRKEELRQEELKKEELRLEELRKEEERKNEVDSAVSVEDPIKPPEELTNNTEEVETNEIIQESSNNNEKQLVDQKQDMEPGNESEVTAKETLEETGTPFNSPAEENIPEPADEDNKTVIEKVEMEKVTEVSSSGPNEQEKDSVESESEVKVDTAPPEPEKDESVSIQEVTESFDEAANDSEAKAADTEDKAAHGEPQSSDDALNSTATNQTDQENTEMSLEQ